MPLEYTNAIGKKFSDFVVEQLAARSAIASKDTRSNSDLMWLTNRTGWVRITSNVDIKPGNPLSTKYGAGDALAKKYILQGGVISTSGKSINLRSGVGFDKAYGVGFDPSNPNDMGFKPMPGVTSFSIECGGPYGAIKTANITIKCYNLEQFNIMETLYGHLGLSMLIEYGHIPYINNAGVLQTKTVALDFFKATSKETIASNITTLRQKTNGNYDALFGTVSNYSWTTAKDGSFEISIKVIGPGQAIESLTINYNTNKPEQPILSPRSIEIYKEFLEQKEDAEGEEETKQLEQEILPGTIASRNNSKLHRSLYLIYEYMLTQQQVENPSLVGAFTNAIGDAIQNTASILTLGIVPAAEPSQKIRITGNPQLMQKIFSQNPSYNLLKDAYAKKGNNFWVIANGKNGDVKDISPNLFKMMTIALNTSTKTFASGISSEATTKDNLPGVYIPLGLLVAIVQANCVLYNTSKNKPNESRPYAYIDFNNFTNLCFATPYTVSVNPAVCLIDIADGNELLKKLFGNVPGKDGKLILKAAKNLSTPIYNPTSDSVSSAIRGAGLGFYNTGTTGYLMNVLVNVEFIVNTIDALAGTDAKKEVKIDTFLQTILDGINNATGGVNEFRVTFNDESYCLSLADEQTIEPPEYSTIDILGLRSILHDYSFTSKISPKLASMIVISAQDNASASQSALDGSAIGKWNSYVKDRIMPNKVDSNEGDQGATSAAETSTAGTEGGDEEESPDQQLMRTIAGIYNYQIYNKDDVDGAVSLLKEKMIAIKANSEATEALAMIPLEMSIKMDGISGILTNQTFTIPPDRLPMSYRDPDNPGRPKFGFVVHKVENSIENNKWYTTFTGQSIFLPKNSTVRSLPPINVPSNPLANATPSSGVQPKSTTDPTVQKNEQEALSQITVQNSGKNTTINTYTYLPKTASKEVDVFIFYPGIDIDEIVGRDYMPKKITSAAPDWFDKYVLVFPTTWTTSYSDVKKEYEALLTKAGLTQRTLNIGIYSGSGNNSASVLSALQNSGKELRNFVMMDPSPSAKLVNVVKAISDRGGTFQYLYYNPAAWGGASYYGGYDSKGELYGPIKTLIDASTKVSKKRTATGHYDIPKFMLQELKLQIEKNLG